MMNLVAAASWAIVLALAAWLRARRSAPAPRPGRALVVAFAALAGQAALFLALSTLVSRPYEGGALLAERLTLARASIVVIQAIRAALIVFALDRWLAAAFADPAARRGVLRSPAGLVALAILIELLQSFGNDALRPLWLVPMIAMLYAMPKSWIDEIRGMRRLAAIPLALAAIIAAQDLGVTGPGGDPVIAAPSGGAARRPLVSGAGSEPFASAVSAARPLTACTRVAATILAASALVALFRLPFSRRLLPALSLRRFSLRRRFTITYFLIRLLPHAIATLLSALAIYFALGLHAASRVRDAFESSLAQAEIAAGAILRDAPVDPFAGGRSRTDELLRRARLGMGIDSVRVHAVLRDVAHASAESGAGGTRGAGSAPADTAPAASDSTSSRTGTMTLAFDPASAAASEEIPPPLASIGVALTPGSTTWRGLVEADGVLYLLAAAAAPAAGDSGGSAAGRAGAAPRADRVAHVYVAVDSLFLARIATACRANVTLRARPTSYITRSDDGISIHDDDVAWATHEIELSSRDSGDAPRDGFLGRDRYFAQGFLTIGDWTQPVRSRGLVRLRLETSLRRVLAGVRAGILPILFTTIGAPLLILALLILGITEGLAVRAGRSIATSILGDVKTLSDAARRIGDGDLEHRVPVAGNDELSGLAIAFNEMTDNLRRHQAELLEKERIEADLAVARDIQMRLLPQAPPIVRGLDIAGVSIPSREVGGDLFSFLVLENGALGVALGDVSGKSVPAALLMSNVLASLKAHSQHAAPVHECLTSINRLLCEDILFGKFVTLFHGVIDPGRGELRYASAGHNPPLIVGAGGEIAWLREAWIPLGIQPDAVYKDAAAPLAAGDTIVVYSDGVTEAETTVDAEEMFGEERLSSTVAALRGASASAIVEGIVAAVREFAAGAPQSDDVTIVVVKLAASAPRA